MCAYLKMCSLLQICVQYRIVVAYVVEIKLNSKFNSMSDGRAFHYLKGHCIEFKYYADGIHSGLTPPCNNS